MEIDPDQPDVFFRLYRRYFVTVRAELVIAGLEPIAAEIEVGAVFSALLSGLDDLAPDAPLGPRLCELARAAAKRLQWPDAESGTVRRVAGASDALSPRFSRFQPLGRRQPDGFYGSGG